jgi:hypothetical protein
LDPEEVFFEVKHRKQIFGNDDYGYIGAVAFHTLTPEQQELYKPKPVKLPF